MILAHRFETAVLQVRFEQPPPPLVARDPGFWKTLSTAMSIAACEVLDIERGDLYVDFRALNDARRGGELFIYDNIAGGAGYSRRVQIEFVRVIRATQQRLEHCDNPECLADSSCFACLRAFENQFDWQLLRRSAVIHWIESLCNMVRR